MPLSTSLLVLLLLSVITFVVPAVNALEPLSRTITAAGDWSTYDVTMYPLVKPDQSAGLSSYVGSMIRSDMLTGLQQSPMIGTTGQMTVYSIGSALRPMIDLQNRTFMCNII